MSLYLERPSLKLLTADARTLQLDQTVQTILTSPPYFGLRDYGNDAQIGLERTVEEYVDTLVQTFNNLRGNLADDGTLWVNLGDAYVSRRAGSPSKKSAMSSTLKGPTQQENLGKLPTNRKFRLPEKNLMMVPARFAIAMQDAGWILRSDIIWHKPNGLPDPTKDRPGRRHEHLFLFSKSLSYRFDKSALPDGDVWTIGKSTYRGAHFATMPVRLALRAVLASTEEGDWVMDPFSGSATTGLAALQSGRRYLGVDINEDYHRLAVETRFPGILNQ